MDKHKDLLKIYAFSSIFFFAWITITPCHLNVAAPNKRCFYKCRRWREVHDKYLVSYGAFSTSSTSIKMANHYGRQGIFMVHSNHKNFSVDDDDIICLHHYFKWCPISSFGFQIKVITLLLCLRFYVKSGIVAKVV